MLGLKKIMNTAGQVFKGTGLSYCETAFATGTSPDHIRVVGEKGLMFGGGIDSPSFCGVKVSWDTSAVGSRCELERRVRNENPSNRVCVRCLEAARDHFEP